MICMMSGLGTAIKPQSRNLNACIAARHHMRSRHPASWGKKPA
ncbi:MAG: hypothetical protein ACJAVR_003841 [Paracoccaceae bacterium]|jgi:hypothetical protein